MSDQQGHLISALDAISHITRSMELVKMAVEQLNQPGPEQLERIHLLLDLYQDSVSSACEEATAAIQSIREQ